jgi:ribosomal protein L37AE/L43A
MKPHPRLNLLPCPFCGGPAELLHKHGAWQPRCTSCFVAIHGMEYSREFAAKRWNRRATTQATTANGGAVDGGMIGEGADTAVKQ